MKQIRPTITLIAAALALLPAAASGQPTQLAASPGLPIPKSTYAPAPAQMQKDGIVYLVGGIGIDSRTAMERVAPEYNTQLVFAASPDGHYVVDVRLKLVDAAGSTRFHLDKAGPIFYAKMPPGRYEVIANFHGEEKRRRIDVGAQGQPVHEGFRW